MKNIEKELNNFINSRGSKVPDKDMIEEANKEPTATIMILFKVINKQLDKLTGEETFEKTKILFHYVKEIIENCDGINRRLLIRKLARLDEKIDRMKNENRKKFVNVKKAFKELKTAQEEIEQVEDKVVEENSKPYEFISYLINEIRDMNYLEHIFGKMPNLIHTKDRFGNTLFHNIIEKYMENIMRNNMEEKDYYSKIVTLILSQKDLSLKEQERRNTLEDIYRAIDKISIGKKNRKNNMEAIEWLKKLVESMKGLEERHPSVTSIASKYNIKVFFDDSIIEKAKLVKTPMGGEQTNREIVKDYVLTIDKENVKEIDDALSCKKLENGNYLLGVHIASILSYYPYDSDIVQEAIERNCSIYLPKRFQVDENTYQKAIPIFPYEFSADTASLIAGKNRFTRSYFFEIDKNGNIKNQRFVKSITKVDKNATHEEVNQVLKNGSDDKELERSVQALDEVTSILDKKYKTLDLYEQIKENTDDFSELRVKQEGAEKIVYKAMVLTGNKVAEFFAEKNYPCLYRVHKINEDNEKKIEEMIKDLTQTYGGENFKKLYQLVEGIYPKGWYQIEGGHDGLNLDHYCHCTSGLRRCADIIVEHSLEVCYDKEPTKEELEELRKEIIEKAELINEKQELMQWFVKDYKRTYQKRR